MKKVFRLLSGALLIAFLIWCCYLALTIDKIYEVPFYLEASALLGALLLVVGGFLLFCLLCYSVYHFIGWIFTGDFDGFR